jgi:DNA-binding beta-propeller fold protein YncE
MLKDKAQRRMIKTHRDDFQWNANFKHMKRISILYLLIAFIIFSCREKEEIIKPTETEVADSLKNVTIKGFFLLNEGNMGSNKSTLDFFDYETGIYNKNIYADRNPGVVKELGDVGNDIKIYGNKLYCVINCSHFIEIMDVKTVKHVKAVSIPNCRYLAFKDQYAYVSSYAGPVKIDPNARLGYVAKVDTASLEVVDTCVVGYQPEEMVIVNNKLYVANSGGYRVPNYDRTVSVIDLDNFKEIKKIDVGINLHRMELDNYGRIWVSSRGDYYHVGSKTFLIDTQKDQVVDSFPLLPNSNMCLSGDSLYVYSTEWSYVSNSNTITYAIMNVKTKKVVTRNFITDGTEKLIKIPYGLAINSNNGEFFVTDAGDYVTPGTLYCFNKDGTKKWSVMTGDIPAHIVFTHKSITNK